jgi:Asp/Glu/hydantoin racemase
MIRISCSSFLDRAIYAEKAGYDVVGVVCLLEPGITAAKEALSIPVVGATEKAMHDASFTGCRFSFLLPGNQEGNLKGADTAVGLEDLAKKYGFNSKECLCTKCAHKEFGLRCSERRPARGHARTNSARRSGG